MFLVVTAGRRGAAVWRLRVPAVPHTTKQHLVHSDNGADVDRAWSQVVRTFWNSGTHAAEVLLSL